MYINIFFLYELVNMWKDVIFTIVYLIMDIMWISIMSNVFYKSKIENIQRSQLSFKTIPAILAYITLVITLFVVCVPLSEYYKNRYPKWLVFGMVGFIIYGVYNFTNAAIFENYDITFVLVDMMWGSISFGTLGMIHNYLKTINM